MERYVILLRGINVSGHNLVPMEQLRKLMQSLGFSDVQTYIQSGNVVVSSSAVYDDSAIAELVGEKIGKVFGFSVPVVVRKSQEINEILKANPFLNQNGLDESFMHVTFLSTTPESSALSKLDSLVAAGEQLKLINREIYLYFPNGYGNTKLTIAAFEKKLGVIATNRNWRTVKKLQELASK